MLCCHGMLLLSQIANLLYPLVCTLCGAKNESKAGCLCSRCRTDIPQWPLSAAPPGQALAPLKYERSAQTLIHQFKYHRRWRLGLWCAEKMRLAALKTLPLHAIDLVACVPAHWFTRRLRGFDAPDYLARRVSGMLKIPYKRVIFRRRWTRSQTRLTRAERLRNVRNAFYAHPKSVGNKTILLIDDVVTSGATTQACVTALRKAQACTVFVLAAARTPKATP